MKPLGIDVIANFFDEVEEEWLVPFDWCPNTKLPNDTRRTYRIKDLFKVRFRNKICRYLENEVDLCRTDFHFIFRYNILHALQAADEISKLKMMADHDHYDNVSRLDKDLNTTTNTSDNSTNTINNSNKGTNKTGGLTGSVDAIQLGSVLKNNMLDVDTEQLPNKVDRNIRQYTQAVNVTNDITEGKVEDIGNSSGSIRVTGNQLNINRQGIEALNQVRAHSLQVRRIHEEFIQCFNVLFY